MDKRVDMWALDDLFGVDRHPEQYVYYKCDGEMKSWGSTGGCPPGDKRSEKQKQNYRDSWTKERKAAYGATQVGNNHNKSRRIPVTIDGVRYESQLAAAKALGKSRYWVAKHVRT